MIVRIVKSNGKGWGIEIEIDRFVALYLLGGASVLGIIARVVSGG